MFEKFRLFRKFRFKKWLKYSPDKRLKYCQLFENYFAKKQKRDKFDVCWKEDLNGADGYCSYQEKRIYILADNIRDGRKMFSLMSTLLHEGRHAFQRAHVTETYKKKSKVFKFSKAYQWNNAMGGYFDGTEDGVDYTDYANQSIELDANMYAYKQLKKLRRKYFSVEEYQAQIDHLENWFEYVAKMGKEKYGRFYKFKIGRKNKKRFKACQKKRK